MYGQTALHHNKLSGWAGAGSDRLPSLSAFRRFGGRMGPRIARGLGKSCPSRVLLFVYHLVGTSHLGSLRDTRRAGELMGLLDLVFNHGNVRGF